MMVASLLPDKRRLNVIRRSFMPFGSPEKFPTRSVMDEAYSCATPIPTFVSTPDQCVASSTNCFDFYYLCEFHSGQVSLSLFC